ncbi:VanZ family protein [Microbacterium oleivorans]|uniref:VanZ family protein n=1 Tax=Microbacterium oleivorans TaxID=273677 RepID=A0A7D5EXB6_9MICO|nr:VanZ family protein [Microbacterium oleivorans]QLD12226.1 VanZ family protein [Microbacterium oleivorans]
MAGSVPARVLLAAFLVALAFVAFWPTPVDRDAGWLVSRITDTVPWLTYGRIEFGANILLFVPLGWCAARGWPRWHAAVIPAALGLSVVIEVGQGVALAERTSSVLDVVANTTGAAIGWAIAMPWRNRRPAAAAASTRRDRPASEA